MAPADPSIPPVTEDRLLGGRLRLRQGADGYRAGMDAMLLAAGCDAKPGETVADAGCGAGAAMLAAAVRHPGASFVGVERDPAALELARANIIINGLGERVTAIAGDVAEPFSRLGRPPFDAALANPPFFDDPTALRPPSPARRAAWIAPEGLLAWLTFLAKAVRDGGVVTVIHRADRLGDLLGGLSLSFGSFQIRPVSPFEDAPAKRVVVRAVKTGKAPLRLLPPLVLHSRDVSAKHTPLAEAILRGDAALDWER
jgi:tRNA1(Val) A37 N6-methylase TrmN6